MPVRRWTIRFLVIAAIVAGFAAIYLGRDILIPPVIGFKAALRTQEDWEKSLAKWKKFTPEQWLILTGSGDALRDYALAHPDRPWLLWRWYTQLPDPEKSKLEDYYRQKQESRSAERRTRRLKGQKGVATTDIETGMTLSADDPKDEKIIEELRSRAEFLAEHDPDNGLPLVLLAALELRQAVRYEYERTTTFIEGKATYASQLKGEVLDQEKAARAVALIREALAKPYIGLRAEDAAREWLSILGSPKNFFDAQIMLAQLYRYGVFHIRIFRDLSICAVMQAEHALATSNDRDEEGQAAFEILRDLQTLGARLVIDNPENLSKIAGFIVASTASEEGSTILAKYGKTAEAGQILARGRNLCRQYFLAGILPIGRDRILEVENPTDSILYNDEFRAEALRLIGEREKNGNALREYFDNENAPDLISLLIPNLNYMWPNGGDHISLDELRTASSMATWANRKESCWKAIAPLMAGFLVYLAAYFIQALRFGKREDSESGWPSLRDMLVAIILFCGIPSCILLLAEFAPVDIFRKMDWLRIVFIWSFFAAFWTAFNWLERGEKGHALTRWLKRIAFLALLSFLVVVCVDIAHPLSGKFKLPVLILFVIPSGFMLAFLIAYLLAYISKKCGARDFATARALLAMFAGGVLFWSCAYFLAERAEEYWTARDTLIVPRSVERTGINMPIENRFAQMHIDYLRKVLAEENDAQSKDHG